MMLKRNNNFNLAIPQAQHTVGSKMPYGMPFGTPKNGMIPPLPIPNGYDNS